MFVYFFSGIPRTRLRFIITKFFIQKKPETVSFVFHQKLTFIKAKTEKKKLPLFLIIK